MRFLIKVFMLLRYRIKYKKDIADFPKLIDVVMSCETPDQCRVALTYITLYRHRYANSTDGFGAITRLLLDRLVMYLLDTSEHVERGFHKPEVHQWKTITHYPDMNDYIGSIINVRFKKSWLRGTPSVISS